MELEEITNLHYMPLGTTTSHDKQQTSNTNTVHFIKRIFRATRRDLHSTQ